ncbi:hypothetical protein [Kerstersia gyiorum]|nr:hypothetical protein [Kerstersia gyiorum]MCH4271039.1 hypothetical protein [Kerstersia gyiorum]MCI1227834.1 hypothetical protein [Kerstersia gyiorum]
MFLGRTGTLGRYGCSTAEQPGPKAKALSLSDAAPAAPYEYSGASPGLAA